MSQPIGSKSDSTQPLLAPQSSPPTPKSDLSDREIKKRIKKIHHLFLHTLSTFVKIFSIEQEIKKIDPNYKSFKNSKQALTLSFHTDILVREISHFVSFLIKSYKSREKYKKLKKEIVSLEKTDATNEKLISKKHHLTHKKNKVYDFLAHTIHKTVAICNSTLNILSASTHADNIFKVTVIASPVVFAMNIGITCFEEVRSRKKQSYYNKKLKNDPSLDEAEKNNIQTKLFHLKNKLALRRWSSVGNIVSNMALLGGSIIRVLPQTPPWMNLTVVTLGVSTIQQVVNIKNIYMNVKKLQYLKKEIRINQTKVDSQSKLGAIYQSRINSLQKAIKNKIIFDIFQNAISMLMYAATTTLAVAALVGAPYVTVPLVVVAFSLFALSQGVDIFRMFKHVKKDKEISKEADKLVKTLDKAAGDPKLEHEFNELKKQIATDFKMKDGNGNLRTDLINERQIKKWYNGLIYI